MFKNPEMFVRLSIIAGLAGIGVPRHKMDDCWSRWVMENKDVDLLNATPQELYDTLVNAAKAAK